MRPSAGWSRSHLSRARALGQHSHVAGLGVGGGGCFLAGRLVAVEWSRNLLRQQFRLPVPSLISAHP
eukprot:457088-Alexandrium_andersonii.AAC.1